MAYLKANSLDLIDEIVHIEWNDHADIYIPTSDATIKTPKFTGQVFDHDILFAPSYARHISLPGPGKIFVEILNPIYEDIDEINDGFKKLASELIVKTSTTQSRSLHNGFVTFCPIIRTKSGQYKKLVQFNLKATFERKAAQIEFRGTPFKNTSALSTGRWFKIATNKADVYKLNADFITNNLNIDASTINPNTVKIYSNGGGVVAQLNSAERIDDIEEIAIHFVGNDDNTFQNNEYFLFYAESPDDVRYDTANQQFNFIKNPYSFSNHYFVNLDGALGKRMVNSATTGSPNRTSSAYYDVQRYESDQYNLLDFRSDAHGSGKSWLGDKFVTHMSKDFSSQFELNNYVVGSELKWNTSLVVVSFSGITQFKLNIGDISDESSYSSVQSNTSHNGEIGRIQNRNGFFTNQTSTISNIALDFSPSSSETTGFIDYLQLEGYKNLIFNNREGSRLYRDIIPNESDITEYSLQSTTQQIIVWDISDKFQIKNIPIDINQNEIKFRLSGQIVNEFIVVDGDQVSNVPSFSGEINNQNLHSTNSADMLVIYHPDFKNVAEKFMAHRESLDGFTCIAADINHVYNEFSGGSVDPTSIRDFCKMIYDRDTSFKYLLLIGDGTFDMRHINDDVVDQNFLPTYQTTQSNKSITSYPADDYFCLLDDDEGGNLEGGIDISVGRFPIQKEQEGLDMLDKIIKYESDASINGDWKQRITIVGDDEDSNAHFRQNEELDQRIQNRYKNFEITKLHFDAFTQEANSAGDRYPAVNENINNSYAKGQFIINYIGHGGNKGLAQERVVDIPQIQTWDRKNGFPIILTATCSFASFDDPDFRSGGEQVILKSNGGAVALMSTVRLVYSQDNFALIKKIFDTLLEPGENGDYRRIGDIYRDAKNRLEGTVLENARKFELFGDPSMRVALPKYEVYTSQINDQNTDVFTDTIGALERVTVNGFIGENGDVKTNFNGELFIKVFDKPITLQTKGQDAKSFVAPFEIQNNVLYQGRVSVRAGQFSYNFVVPRDINYIYGEGKILHYAKTDDGIDATGVLDGIIIGGTAKNPIVDNQPPTVTLYMEDESFVSGNSVPTDPLLILDISDDFGINISGTSIGHDVTSTIDGDNRTTKVLNEFYVAALDQPAQGRVEYQLKDLEAGLHTIRAQAWDIANNKGEAIAEFLVIDKDEFTLNRIYNYPNPFTTNTNFQFEHDLPTSALDVQIDIYTISGNRVKTIQESVVSEGNLVRNIPWDGLDEFGDDLARGVYLYKINVRTDNNGVSSTFTGESDFERLVILK